MSAKTYMIIMDLGDLNDDFSSIFKSADVIMSQIGSRRCTACEQIVNKYATRVGKKVIRGTFFIYSTCSASFNNTRHFLLAESGTWQCKVLVKTSRFEEHSWILKCLSSWLLQQQHKRCILLKMIEVQVVQEYFLKHRRLWHNHQPSSLCASLVHQF